MANVLTDLLDDEDLHESARNFKKSAGQIKKSSKSIVKAAKGNIFEFPVFVANSVPLDYATATVSLLEQVYASYLQMAISINPIIDDKTAREGSQFDHLKSDTSKYLECVDPTDMPYAFDACHSVYTENGIVAEFNLVNIEDTTARIINEAMDHEPLSEFDHFFSETYSGDGAGFFEGCTWIQEADNTNGNSILDDILKELETKYDDLKGQETKKTVSTTTGPTHNENVFVPKDEHNVPLIGPDGKAYTLKTSSDTGEVTRENTTEMSELETTKVIRDIVNTYTNTVLNAMKIDAEKMRWDPDKGLEFEFKDGTKKQISTAELENMATGYESLSRIKQAQIDDIYRETMAALDAKYKTRQMINAREMYKKLQKENTILADQVEHLEEDRQSREAQAQADVFNKMMGGAKAAQDIEKSKVDIAHTKQMDQWASEDRELDRMKKLNDARMKTPQMLDETKIQKLNTMKPLMMSVDLNVVDENGSLSRPVSYVIGVKCHTRLIESNILPEVAAYPLKEMNNKLRKIKWRSGELKFGKDLLWKIGSKKQTAVDSHDKKRKWYRRLYELSHMSGDGLAAASVKNGKSPWANWWQDKLTGGHNKNVGHGLIPNATIVMSKSDVDNIKREKDIDLLSGSKASKFCKELFLIGLVVIDDDAESVKVLLPDLHEDYDVMSIAAVKKQLAQLDTAGNKTRDIMKLLG